ncbi:MAG: thermonuclease family protein [Xanthobacteraceae bacterium]|nr:thermonuclease family protein [Xanthobacteraceae bacterium]
MLAAAIFAAGLLTGATLAPVAVSRGSAQPAEPVATKSADASPVRLGHRAEVVRVVDGDTFDARVHLWPGLDITTRVRLRGIDAPEMKARCGDERAQAEAARHALAAILDQGEVGIARITLDKYGGRVVADAFTQATPDVSAALLGSGAVRRYSGGRRDGWCP